MRTTRAIGVAAAMIGVLAAAGCSSGSGDNAASPTTTGTHGIASGEPTPPQTSSSPAPTSPTSTPTTNSTEAGAPGVPSAARQHTKAGAQAFTEHYLRRVNALFRKPESGNLRALESADCTICQQTDRDLNKMRKAGQYYDRDQIKFKVSSVDWISGGSAHVLLTMWQQPARLLDADGKVLSTTPTPTVKSIAKLSWGAGKGWKIDDVANNG